MLTTGAVVPTATEGAAAMAVVTAGVGVVARAVAGSADTRQYVHGRKQNPVGKAGIIALLIERVRYES